MAKEVVELTKEGYDKLVAELEYLKTVKRDESAEKIKVARGYGDLSENAEYDAAKDEQGHVEQRILEIEAQLKVAVVTDTSRRGRGVIGVGSTVTVLNTIGTKTMEATYMIVGSTEFDPVHGKISDDSPIGAALKGHKTGDTVTVELPTGATATLTVKKVENRH